MHPDVTSNKPGGASRELELLVQLMPDDAHLADGEKVTDVKTVSLKQNDVILVKMEVMKTYTCRCRPVLRLALLLVAIDAEHN